MVYKIYPNVEKTRGFCFICIESAEESHCLKAICLENLRNLSKKHKNREIFLLLNFCHLQYYAKIMPA